MIEQGARARLVGVVLDPQLRCTLQERYLAHRARERGGDGKTRGGERGARAHDQQLRHHDAARRAPDRDLLLTLAQWRSEGGDEAGAREALSVWYAVSPDDPALAALQPR